MIVGILSDTHDRTAAMMAGLRVLRDAGAAYFIHCGDIGGEGCIDLLAGEKAAFVWGNTDWDRPALARYAASIRVACYGSFADLRLGGKRLAVLHGDDAKLKRSILDGQEYDYLLQGHTHVADDRRVGRTRLINPGALFRTAAKSVATLDLTTDRLSFHAVEA